MRAWLSPFLVLLAVPGWSGEERLPLLGDAANVSVRHVPLFTRSPGRTRIGALDYLGGVELSSRDPAFGGFSALRVDGDRFLLLSDGGNIVRFTMGADWTLRDAAFSHLIEGPRTGWEKRDRDSESLATDFATGRSWVGFESANAIWRYDSQLERSQGSRRPPEMRRWSRNGGPESMVRLEDGRFVVLSERSRAQGSPEGSFAALLFDGDPVEPDTVATRFHYLPPQGFNPTGADRLADGRIVVIHRRVGFPQGFEAVLSIVDPDPVRENALVEGQEIARFEGGLRHGFGRDNFEAISVVEQGSEVIIWLATDDNQQWPQRSLLLKFRLASERLP